MVDRVTRRANLEEQGSTKHEWPWGAIGAVAAIVAIAVTIYFSVRAERTKELTVKYLDKRTLVSLEGAHSVPLEVTLGGSRIGNPWLLTIRIENTGNQAIEERDVESFPTLLFARGKVVRADVAQKSQPGLYAQARSSDNQVTVEHKLLNSGDWINVDILSDGEPEVSSVSFRISGISQPKQLVLLGGERTTYLTAVPLPRPAVYTLLSIASIGALLFLVGGVALIGMGVGPLFGAKGPTPPMHERGLFHDPEYLMRTLHAESREGRIVLAAVAPLPASLQLLDDPSALAHIIAERVPAAVLQALKLGPNAAAERLLPELRKSLKARLAGDLFASLPPGADRKARREMIQFSHDVSPAAMIEQSKKIFEEHTKELMLQKSAIESEPILAGLALFVGGASAAILLGGTWRTMLGM